MVEFEVSADRREKFISEAKALTGINWREQLFALNARVIAAAMRGDLTQDDAETVSAEINARLQRHHEARARAEGNRLSLGAKVGRIVERAGNVARRTVTGSSTSTAPTSVPSVPRREYEPLPDDQIRILRERRDRHRQYAKLARWPAKHWFFTEAQGAVLAVIVWDVLRFGSCTRSYDSLMKAAGVCRAIVAETITILKDHGLMAITRRRHNSNLITTLPGKIHDYIFKVAEETQLSGRERKKGPLYSLTSQTLDTGAPKESPLEALTPSPKGEEPRTAEARPEPSSTLERAKAAPTQVERNRDPGVDSFLDAIERRLGLPPRSLPGRGGADGTPAPA